MLFQIGALLGLAIAYWTISSSVRARRFKSFALQHGCQDPLDISDPWYGRHWRIRRVFRLKQSGEDIIDDVIADDFKESPTVQRMMFEGSTTISTIEPANIQAMLATQFKEFETGRLRYLQFSPILGKSIFTSDGTFWEHSRALFRPQFSRDNINDLESTDKAAHALIKATGPVDDAGWTGNVELQPLFYNFTLDTASDFLFGESVESQAAAIAAHNSQKAEPAEGQTTAQASSEEFLEDFRVVGDYLIMRIRLNTLYWVVDSLKFRKAIGRVRTFTERFVQAAIDATRSEKVAGTKDNLLARLATQTQDLTELRDQTLAILFAGRDTTAGLLGWCFLRLSLHPEVFAKLRSVVLREFLPGGDITFAKLKACRYLQHFLNEVLRLHPIVPLNVRVAVRDTTLPIGGGPDQRSPIAVRKGQAIFFSVYLMQRRKDLWGDDALEFRPERWEQRIPAWQFVPFSGGPRICLGQQFALTESSYVLVTLLQHFDAIEPVDKAQMRRMRKGLGLTMWPADGVKVRLHRQG